MSKSVREVLSAFAFIGLTGLTGAAAAQAQVNPQDKVLDFDVMAGVTAPFTGTANPIRGVPGGGLPWELDRGKGVLRANGQLDIDVRGLVLARRDPVPPDRQGTNPVASFRAIVSCVSFDSMLAKTIVNMSTDNFPASPEGNARIRATVELPKPCFAPIVFVTSPTGSWFAVTGVESVR